MSPPQRLNAVEGPIGQATNPSGRIGSLPPRGGTCMPDDTRSLESTFELIERAREGDQESLERLMARHLGPLRRFVSGRLPRWARDMSDTDDLVQDTLLKT